LTGSITDPQILIYLRKKLEEGQTGAFFCLSFLQKALIEQKPANNALGRRLNDDKLFLIALRQKIEKCKAKLMEAVKIDLGKTLANTQIDTEDEVRRLREQRKTSPHGKRTLVIDESEDKSIPEDTKPANEVSSPSIIGFEDKKVLQENLRTSI